MSIRKYAHGEVSDVSGTDDTMRDVSQAEDSQAADNDVELEDPNNDDYHESN